MSVEGANEPEGEHHARLSELFEQARGLEGDERERFLVACREADAPLCEELEGLLGALEGTVTDAFSERGIAAARASLDELLSVAVARPQAPGLPERIGPYRILRRLGQGGMGTVYEAEQQAPRRRVALKLIHPFLADEVNLARFRREAELLGRLSHRGIAQILELGTAELGAGSQPFFAMQLVEGRPLLEYAREELSSLVPRLTLFARVCDAVQHAHERGIVHRDLKSENVLVDERGQPTVLDFGIAKSLEGDVTRHTQRGQMLGTLVSMSPEQLRGETAVIDQRSDVYSLGVLLFEVLSGRPPFFRHDEGWDTALRAIEDSSFPRLRELDRALAGDLETVVETSLRADPARRYPDAGALGDDLRRVMAGEPIAARPSTSWYRLRRFVSRERKLVLGLAGIFLALAAGAVTSLGFGLKASEAQAATQRSLYFSQMLRGCRLAEQTAGGPRLSALAAEWLPERQGGRDLRGWEWSVLRGMSRPPACSLQSEFDVMDAEWSPDGARLATAGAAALDIWDPRTGEQLQRLRHDGARIYRIAWEPAGARIAAATSAGFAVWELATGQVSWTWPHEKAGHLLWHPDGDALIFTVGHPLNRTVVYELESEQITHGVDGVYGSFSFDPECARIVALDRGTPVRIFDARTLAPLDTIGGPDGRPEPGATVCVWSPDGSRVAYLGWDKRLHVTELATRTTRSSAEVFPVQAHGLDWSPDGRRLVTGAWDSTVRVWDAQELRELFRFRGHRGRVRSVSWSRDGRWIASAGDDAEVRVWDAEGPRAVSAFDMQAAAPSNLMHVEFRGDELTATHGHLVKSVDLRRQVDLGADRRGYTANADGSLRADFLAIYSGAELLLEFEGEPEQRFAWHPRDPAVFARLQDSRVRVQTPDGSVRWEREVPWLGLRQLAWSPDGERLAIVTSTAVELVDAATGALLQERRVAEYGAYCADWRADGARLVLGLGDNTARVLDTSNGAELLRVEHHAGPVSALAWSPDGQRIASGGHDGLVNLWEADTGTLAASFEFEKHIQALAWSEDGAHLAALETCGQLKLWSAAAASLPAAR